MSDPRSILQSVFGFDAFRPGQAGIVDHILDGTPTLCVMPTGAGKSILVAALGLVLGSRGRSELVRASCSQIVRRSQA